MQNPNRARPRTSQDFETKKTEEKKRRTKAKNKTRDTIPKRDIRDHQNQSGTLVEQDLRKKEAQDCRGKKASRAGKQSANGQGTFLRKLRATAEINVKIEKPSYHKTWDDDKALIKPFLSSHVGIMPNPRSDTTLAYALLVKGWGGGGGGGDN